MLYTPSGCLNSRQPVGRAGRVGMSGGPPPSELLPLGLTPARMPGVSGVSSDVPGFAVFLHAVRPSRVSNARPRAGASRARFTFVRIDGMDWFPNRTTVLDRAP